MCLAVFSMFPYDLTLVTFLNLWDLTRFGNIFTIIFSNTFSPCLSSLLVIPIPHLLGLLKLYHISLKLCSARAFALYFKIWIIYIILLSFQPSIVPCKLQPAFVFLDSQFCICTLGDPWLCWAVFWETVQAINWSSPRANLIWFHSPRYHCPAFLMPSVRKLFLHTFF